MLELLKGGQSCLSSFLAKSTIEFTVPSLKGSRLTDSFVKVNNLFHIKNQ